MTLRSVGANGGQAAAFTYDLARSVVYTRQGNPAWAGQSRDGQAGPIRSDNLFFGDAAGDPQPDWVDRDKVAIPQADEQQRLLANLIGEMNVDRKPLPRFWYFPRGEKAVVVMTGDDHAGGGTAGRFDQYKALSPTGCSVADWECVRGTSYIYPNSPLTNAQAAGYEADGFEVALHASTGCANFTPPVARAELHATSSRSSPPSTRACRPRPPTAPTASPGATGPRSRRSSSTTASGSTPTTTTGRRAGSTTRRDCSPARGCRCASPTLDGSMIDVYQATTQMTDESGQSYPFTANALLDRAIGSEGYYGAFVANMHTDSASSAGSDAIVASAQARGVPVVSSAQMLRVARRPQRLLVRRPLLERQRARVLDRRRRRRERAAGHGADHAPRRRADRRDAERQRRSRPRLRRSRGSSTRSSTPPRATTWRPTTSTRPVR